MTEEQASGNAPQYAIRTVVNPYKWGSGDHWSVYDTLEEANYWVGEFIKRHPLPDLEDRTLRDKGYPNHQILEFKVYEVKEIAT